MGVTEVPQMKVWQKAYQLTLDVYKLTRSFPRDERFGLSSQMQRAAVSIPGNIAEGFIRAGAKEKARFYNIARASAEELRTYFLLSKDLGYVSTIPVPHALLDEVCAMLHRLWELVLASLR